MAKNRWRSKERWLRYGGEDCVCGLCGRLIALEDFTIDHILPKSRGGSNHVSNRQPAHGACNKKKGDSLLKIRDDWLIKGDYSG